MCIVSFRTVIFDTFHIFCTTPFISIFFTYVCFGATSGCLLSAPPFLPSCIVVVTCTRARELCRCKVVHAPCEAPEGADTCSHIFRRISAPRRCLQAEGPLQGSPRSSPRSSPRVACRGGDHRRGISRSSLVPWPYVQKDQEISRLSENPATSRKATAEAPATR